MNPAPNQPSNQAPVRQLHRSAQHRMIAGVAGGIAEYLGIDPTIMRVLWLVGGLIMVPMTAPLALILYFALALVMPPPPPES